REKFPKLFLVIVPRHFERGKEVGGELRERGLKFVYRSEITAGTHYNPGELDCLLVNTTGELKYFYEQASVIFVGKSLTAEGGQNPIEPAALAKPAVFGPHMQNFADVARLLTARDAAVQVRDAAELEQTLAETGRQNDEREHRERDPRRPARVWSAAVPCRFRVRFQSRL